MQQEANEQNTAKILNVLLVEDNPGDVELTQRILRDSKFDLRYQVAEDGEVAMAYLRKEDQFANAITPDLILLDLKMPKKDGYEVLTEMRQSEVLREIPTMVITSTGAEGELLFNLGVHPRNYVRKPLDLGRFEFFANNLSSGGLTPLPESDEANAAQETGKKWWPFGGKDN